MAGEVGLRRFEGGAAGIENDVESGIGAFQTHADHFADTSANAVAVVRLPDSAWDGKPDTGSGVRCARVSEKECHKVGTRKTAALVVDFAKVGGLEQPVCFWIPVTAWIRRSWRRERRVRH